MLLALFLTVVAPYLLRPAGSAAPSRAAQAARDPDSHHEKSATSSLAFARRVAGTRDETLYIDGVWRALRDRTILRSISPRLPSCFWTGGWTAMVSIGGRVIASPKIKPATRHGPRRRTARAGLLDSDVISGPVLWWRLIRLRATGKAGTRARRC